MTICTSSPSRGFALRDKQRYWFSDSEDTNETRRKRQRQWNYKMHSFLSTRTYVSLFPSLHSECSGPLGMEGGIISNQQITASSTHRALFGLQKWYPYFARLNKKGLVNAWTAAENDRWPWIQVKHCDRTSNTQSRARTRYTWIKTEREQF